MANMDREVLICYQKKFLSGIEAVVDASGVFSSNN
jgi:hypothetical protein